jgi:predicted XRE-type DNA-binding protein
MSSAAKVAGVPRSDLSRIRNKQLERFRLDRLIVILGNLDEDVEVNVTFTSRKHSRHLA